MSLKENTLLTRRLPYWALGLSIMAIIETIGFARESFQVTGNTLRDYDTLTRLAYLRQAMERHAWTHGFFDRLNPPSGMVLHWTLPFNVFMLALIKLFSLFDPQTALHYAGYWAGTVIRVAVGPAAYWAGRQIVRPVQAMFASVLVLFSPYLLAYGHRGDANHHALMFLETVLMAGLAFRLVRLSLSNLRLPLAVGAMAGLCLWTTFELVIVVGPLFATLFFLWVTQGEARLKQLLLTSAAFTVTVTLAVLADPPYGGIGAPVLDHISMPYQTLSAIPLILALGAWLRRPRSEQRRAGYLLLAGMGAGLAWLACYPFALHGIKGTMDPYLVQGWIASLEENSPIQGWRSVAGFMGPVLIAAILVFKWRVERERREPVLLSLGCLFVMGLLHFRFALYGAVGAPYYLAYVYERARLAGGEFPPDFRRYAHLAAFGMAALYVAVQGCALIGHFDVMNEPPGKSDVPEGPSCDPWLVRGPMSDAAWLGVRTPIVVDELNHAAALLYWTDVRPLAGNYHRDSAGIKDEYLFFRDLGDAAAREIARRHGADFVLVCGGGRNWIYSFVSAENAFNEMRRPTDEFYPEDTIYTRLNQKRPPPWLVAKPWPDGVKTDLLLYRVDKDRLGE